jgi:hypothetical protein
MMMINQVLEEIVLPSPASLGKEKGRWGVCKPCVFAGIWQTPTPTLQAQVHTLMQIQAVAPGVVKLVTITQSIVRKPRAATAWPLLPVDGSQGTHVQSAVLFKKYLRAGGPPMQSTTRCTSLTHARRDLSTARDDRCFGDRHELRFRLTSQARAICDKF